jgi:1-phosphatidylinositol phosphodiesterase
MKRLIGKATVIAISMFLSLFITAVASGFEKWDGLAAGDVDKDGKAEIIHGDRSTDQIQIFDMKGTLLDSFPLNFEGKDGLTAGDVIGDGKAEIIHGDRSEDKIRIFFKDGAIWKEESFEYHFEKGDRLTAGDVIGDEKAEIIHGDRSEDKIHIFFKDGAIWGKESFSLNFEDGDGLTAGNVDGEGKAEIIHGDRADVISIFSKDGGTWQKKSFEWNFAEWDGLTAGDVDGDGDAEIIHGDRDDQIHIFFLKDDGGWDVESFPVDFEQGDRLTAGDVNKDDCDSDGNNCAAEIIHGDRNDLIWMYDMEGHRIDNFSPSRLQWGNVWFNNKRDIGYRREDWMGELDEKIQLSQLSIPGTHDTMSHYGGGLVKTQTFRLDQQLKSGIRALDIRCRHVNNQFDINHGREFQHARFDDVLDICIQFLANHSKETILMRIKKEHTTENCTRAFDETFQWYWKLYKGDKTFWIPSDENPTLKDVRGKIVILQNFDSAVTRQTFGLLWSEFNIQDEYAVCYDHMYMNHKWYNIKNQLITAQDTQSDPPPFSEEKFINFTSGAPIENCTITGVITPVQIAHGLKIYFEYCHGMNERTYRYLTQELDNKDFWRTGIIMMDFPGAGLIDVIIAHNGLDLIFENNAPNAPEADANGPYVSDEGSEITFEASASFDTDGDALQYRWDLDDDEIWDTEWSSSPTAVFTWYDDYTGVAQLEVKDGNSVSDIDMTTVTVNNVAPMTTIDSISSPVKDCILPGQEVGFVGSFTDPGYLDTHTAQWDFGDGSIVPGTLTEENDEPDATGSVEDGHTFSEPGIFTVRLEIEDDDSGSGTDEIEVEVMAASEAVDFADSFIQNLPESCLSGQADNRKNALSNKFKEVKNALVAGDIRDAINKLINDIRAKSDSSVDGKPNNDWITDGDAQEELCLVIDELVKYLESLQDG